MPNYQTINCYESLEDADYSQPFVIRNIVPQWPAASKWDWEFFSREYGHKQLYVFRSDGYINARKTHAKMSLRQYINYILTTSDTEPYYLVDYFVYQNMPDLIKDFETPPEFRSWFNKLPYKLMPKFLSLYIGPKHSMSQLHFDIMNTVAWNACLLGKKEWYFYPPSEGPKLYNSKVNAFEPDLERFPEFSEARGYHYIQKPGDLIYTPAAWWHTVRNLESSIALTDNFLNKINAKQFFKHFFPALKHLLIRTWKRKATPRNRLIDDLITDKTKEPS